MKIRSIKSALRPPQSALFQPSAFRLSGFLLLAGLCLLSSGLCPLSSVFLTPAEAAQGMARLNQTRGRMNSSAKQQGRQNRGDSGYLANIDENWFLEYSLSYIKSGNTDIDNYFGASIAIGYKVTQNDRFQFEIGILKSNTFTDDIKDYPRDFIYNRWLNGTPDSATQKNIKGVMLLSGKKQASAVMVPTLVTYTYSVRVDPRERWELRVSPVAGFLTMFGSWKVKNAKGSFTDATDIWIVEDPRSLSGGPLPGGNSYIPDGRATINATENFTGKGVRCVFAMGAGFGAAWHFSDRWYADIGYRWLWTDRTSAKLDTANGSPWNAVVAWTGMNTHTYTATLGWKF